MVGEEIGSGDVSLAINSVASISTGVCVCASAQRTACHWQRLRIPNRSPDCPSWTYLPCEKRRESSGALPLIFARLTTVSSGDCKASMSGLTGSQPGPLAPTKRMYRRRLSRTMLMVNRFGLRLWQRSVYPFAKRCESFFLGSKRQKRTQSTNWTNWTNFENSND